MDYEKSIARLNRIIKALDKDKVERGKIIEDVMTIVSAGHRSGQIREEIYDLLSSVLERYIILSEEKASTTRKRRIKCKSGS